MVSSVAVWSYKFFNYYSVNSSALRDTYLAQRMSVVQGPVDQSDQWIQWSQLRLWNL